MSTPAIADVSRSDGRHFQPLAALGLELSDDVLRRAGAVDQALQQAVRGQPVGPVEARAGDLARGPEAGQGSAAFRVHRHAAHHVMGARADRDRIASDVESEFTAHFVDAGKPLMNMIGGDVG